MGRVIGFDSQDFVFWYLFFFLEGRDGSSGSFPQNVLSHGWNDRTDFLPSWERDGNGMDGVAGALDGMGVFCFCCVVFGWFCTTALLMDSGFCL